MKVRVIRLSETIEAEGTPEECAAFVQHMAPACAPFFVPYYQPNEWTFSRPWWYGTSTAGAVTITGGS